MNGCGFRVVTIGRFLVCRRGRQFLIAVLRKHPVRCEVWSVCNSEELRFDADYVYLQIAVVEERAKIAVQRKLMSPHVEVVKAIVGRFVSAARRGQFNVASDNL